MLRVAWELPRVPSVEPSWLGSRIHLRRRPRFSRQEPIGRLVLGHWRAIYERHEYPDALDALVTANLAWARNQGGLPSLYSTGVRYMAECCGEVWRHAVAVLHRGGGDCEDLAAYRCAELRALGEPAMIHLSSATVDGGALLWHVRVLRASGEIEDPSAVLGEAQAICDRLGPDGLPCKG